MDYMKLAELLFPHITKTPEEYEDIYPDRKLPEGARVPVLRQVLPDSYIWEIFTAHLSMKDWRTRAAAHFF